MPSCPSHAHSERNHFADDVSAVVIDIGTHSTKAGYAGEDTPRCVIPSVRFHRWTGYLELHLVSVLQIERWLLCFSSLWSDT